MFKVADETFLGLLRSTDLSRLRHERGQANQRVIAVRCRGGRKAHTLAVDGTWPRDRLRGES